jgi:hypothetical protein
VGGLCPHSRLGSGVGSAETKCTLPQPTGPATVQSPLTASSPSPPTPTAVGSGPMCVLCRWVWRRPWHCVQLASSKWNAPYTHFRFPLRCSPPAAAQQTGKPVTRALAGMGHVRYASIISSFFPRLPASLCCYGANNLSRQCRRTPLFPRILGSSVCGEEIEGRSRGSTPSATSSGLDPLAFGIRAGALHPWISWKAPAPRQEAVNGVRTGR